MRAHTFTGCVQPCMPRNIPLPHVKHIVLTPNNNTLAVGAKTHGKDLVIYLKLMGDAPLEVPQSHHPIGTPTDEAFPIWTEGKRSNDTIVCIEQVSERAIEFPYAYF